MIYELIEAQGPLRQCEIVTGLVQRQIHPPSLNNEGNGYEIIERVHPYAIVMSQDCDLDLDFSTRQETINSDKRVPNVLFCMVDTAENLFALGREEGWLRSSTQRTFLKNNKNERYHFLEEVPAEYDLGDVGLPELGIDFKRFFSVPTEEVYSRLEATEILRRCRLASPYLEHLSTRFAHFLSRIALPMPHQSE